MVAAPAATSAPGTGIQADPTANFACNFTTSAISSGKVSSAALSNNCTRSYAVFTKSLSLLILSIYILL